MYIKKMPLFLIGAGVFFVGFFLAHWISSSLKTPEIQNETIMKSYQQEQEKKHSVGAALPEVQSRKQNSQDETIAENSLQENETKKPVMAAIPGVQSSGLIKKLNLKKSVKKKARKNEEEDSSFGHFLILHGDVKKVVDLNPHSSGKNSSAELPTKYRQQLKRMKGMMGVP